MVLMLLENEDRLHLLNFVFRKNTTITGLLIVALLLYYAIYLLSFWLKGIFHQRKVRKLFRMKLCKWCCRWGKKVLEYLGSNFSNQNLSLFRMSEEIGISSNKISAMIKKRYNLTFRQYLNTIRIAESKRLLQETKLQISQIAYRVGYTNLTHFCRTFKEVT